MKIGILHTVFITLIAAGIIILLLLLGTIIPGYNLSAHKTETNSEMHLDSISKQKLLPVDSLNIGIIKTSIEKQQNSFNQ